MAIAENMPALRPNSREAAPNTSRTNPAPNIADGSLDATSEFGPNSRANSGQPVVERRLVEPILPAVMRSEPPAAVCHLLRDLPIYRFIRVHQRIASYADRIKQQYRHPDSQAEHGIGVFELMCKKVKH